MNLDVLLLDDELSSLRDPLQEALRPFLDGKQVPALAGGSFSIRLNGIGDQSVDLTITCNSGTTFSQVRKEIEDGTLPSEFDLVLLDDQWKGGEGEFAGQEVLLEPVFRRIRSKGGGYPVIVLWTQEWDQETRTDKFTQLLASPPYWGSNRVRGLSKTNMPGLRLLIQDALASRQLKNENDLLKRQRDLAIKVAHSHLKLLQYTSHLVGIDQTLLEVAEAVDPLFKWKDKEDDQMPEEFKLTFPPEFPCCLLFVGEPGSGKSAICDAIAEAFKPGGRQPVPYAPLPKDLGPKAHPGGWKAPLKEQIKRLYSKARKRRVVVIRADDLTWQGVADGTATSSEWLTYYNVLRDCIRDAFLINKGEAPESEIVRDALDVPDEPDGLDDYDGGTGNHHQLQGKILWLFARNTAADVGDMFEPLMDILLPWKVSFPAGLEERKQILALYAGRRNMVFEPEALDDAAEKTISYSGRDLIGDSKQTNKGFIYFAYGRVRERARVDIFAGRPMNNVIDKSIVDAWLSTEQHKRIAEHTCGVSPPSGTGSPPLNISVVELKLNRLQELFSQGKQPVEAGKELFNGDPLRNLSNFIRNKGTIEYFHNITEVEARSRFYDVVKHIARTVQGKTLEKFPDYVRRF